MRDSIIAALLTSPLWFASALIAYWYFLDYEIGPPPITMQSKVLTPIVARGEIGAINYVYHINRDCPRKIETWLEPHQILLRDHGGSTTGQGTGERRPTFRFVVPKYAEPGPATVVSNAEVWCNRLRPWRFSHATEFRIR